MSHDHNAMVERLQALRQTIAALSDELDGYRGNGTPGRINSHYAAWSAALVGLLVATPIDPPADTGPGCTTYNS